MPPSAVLQGGGSIWTSFGKLAEALEVEPGEPFAPEPHLAAASMEPN